MRNFLAKTASARTHIEDLSKYKRRWLRVVEGCVRARSARLRLLGYFIIICTVGREREAGNFVVFLCTTKVLVLERGGRREGKKQKHKCALVHV